MGGETIAELLRMLRTRGGLSQAALAEKAGLSEQAISLLERGARRRPRIDTVESLIVALELAPDDAERLRSATRDRRRQVDPPTARPRASTVVPKQLPPTLSDFTGRQTELNSLLRTLAPPSGQPVATVGMTAVTGMGGVGKTSLAIHAAHLAADTYADGQIYLDLRGYGPGEPIQPADALAQLLRSLGVDGRAIPEGADEAAALYRSRLAGLRVLILLDNANGAAQVRPLLPGGPGSAVIMTSRRGLTALAGVVHVRLAPLPEADAVELLRKIVGDARVSAENSAARSVAELTGHLPLAVRLIGARLAARPSWPIGYLVDQLQNERRRLDELSTGDSGVRANIDGSVQFLAGSEHDLDRRAAEALVYLGLPEGPDLAVATVARLLDQPESETGQMLERLVDLNLLESIAPARYRLHDLIRAYARERADQELTTATRIDALTRVLQFYVGAAWRCQRITHPQSRRLALATQTDGAPDFADAASALEWLEVERSNITRAVRQATRSPELRQIAPELSLAMFGYHESRSRWGDMRNLVSIGRTVAGDPGLERLAAWLEHDLAIPDTEQGLFETARRHLLRSLEMFRADGDEGGQARSYSSLSHVCERMGLVDEALNWAEGGLALSRRIGDETVEGISYLALAGLHVRRGDQAKAGHYFDLSIGLAERAGNLRSLAKRHQNIGRAYLDAGLIDAAAASLSTGLQLFEQIGDRGNLFQIHLELATIYLTTADFEVAKQHAEAGLRDARASDDTRCEGQLLTVLGQIQSAQGDQSGAHSSWKQAAALLHAVSPSDESAALELLNKSDGHNEPGA